MPNRTPTARPLLTKELLLVWADENPVRAADVDRAIRGCSNTIAELAYEIGADAPGRRLC